MRSKERACALGWRRPVHGTPSTTVSRKRQVINYSSLIYSLTTACQLAFILSFSHRLPHFPPLLSSGCTPRHDSPSDMQAADANHALPWHHVAHVPLVAAPSKHAAEFRHPQSLPPVIHASSKYMSRNTHPRAHLLATLPSCTVSATDPRISTIDPHVSTIAMRCSLSKNLNFLEIYRD